MGKSHLEMAIQNEAKNFVKNLEILSSDGEPHEIPFTLNLSVLNVIWQLVSSNVIYICNNDHKILF